MANEDQIDTEMYLRDGYPHAVVCKVQLKDGRIGIGVARQDPTSPGSLAQQAMDKAALDDALENVPDADDVNAARAKNVYDGPPAAEPDHDLQASLGQKAHG